MGRGKAKGWRPPAASDPAASLLLGNADSCTGNTIASPVQLRAEGIPMPKEHMNYGGKWIDDDKSDKGKGKKGTRNGNPKGDAPAAKNPYAAPSSKAPAAATSLPAPIAPSSKAPAVVTSAPPRAKAPSVVKDEVVTKEELVEEEIPVKEEITETQDVEAHIAVSVRRHERERQQKDDTPSEAPKAPEANPSSFIKEEPEEELAPKDEAKSEIQRRREALKTLKEEELAPKDETKSEIQRRREALEALKASQEVPPKEEPLDAEDSSKRRRIDANTDTNVSQTSSVAVAAANTSADTPPATAAAPAKAKASGANSAVQQGLQRWASQVNALAGTDAELVRKCREFVRKRILRAHAVGNLHATDWDKEPVPTVEDLRGESL